MQRADELSKASLEREAIPDNITCARCGRGDISRWRCKDCIFPDVLCRGCMRRTHMINPLHRIEHWTGKCFQRAELRDVGIFVVIKHRGTGMCDSLTGLIKVHEDVQATEDENPTTGSTDVDVEIENAGAGTGTFDFDTPGADGGTPDDKDDAGFEEYMRKLYEEDTMGSSDTEEDDDGGMGGHGMEGGAERARTDGAHTDASSTCCIVHTNGVHHLPLVTCGCRGPEEVFLDLANARFLPTSFSRISTVFTTAVLDDFRLSNLECKVSAYQYWQRLSRLTSPVSPVTVSNRYKELLRMSRVWRWMKKLKWAGFVHNQQRSDQPKDGQLSIFCPACPQPGINIPPNWKDDPKRYAR